MEAYDEKIVLKPMIIVINKIDLCKDEQVVMRISFQCTSLHLQALHSLISQLKSREWINNLTPSLRPIKGFNIEDVVAISAKSGQIQELKTILRARSSLINCNNHVE